MSLFALNVTGNETIPVKGMGFKLLYVKHSTLSITVENEAAVARHPNTLS